MIQVIERQNPVVPFVDLRAQHEELREQIQATILDIVNRSTFIGGPYVESFEKDFAAYCGIDHCVTCGSGTDALKLALMAAEVKPGDEVITVPHTFIASVEAITLAGANPMFVDIDAQYYTLSPRFLLQFLEERCTFGPGPHPINKRTGRPVVAVMPVHLYGLPADLDSILSVSRTYNLKVIEDACQAHGATLISNGSKRKVGTFGEAAAFSFYPGKNLGAMGEGGAVTTKNPEKARTMRMWRDHGQSERYIHLCSDGWNSRLDAIQCGILSVKLRRLDIWNERRCLAAQWYRERLKTDDQIVLPVEPPGRKHVYHLFVVRVPDRDKVRQRLADQGISTGLHYPIPLHLQPAYRSWGWKEGDFPESERAAATILSLPLHPHIEEEQVDRICEALKDALV
jgi:dTDP-4-amino-4,6-dideoxygalactose transaminase